MINIGFIGSGFARKVQAPAFAMFPQARLAGVASPNNAAEFASALDIPFHTDDYRELILREDIDLVCITSPPAFHFEQALFAMEHNKHILCEKPFTMNVLEARQLAERADGYPKLAIIDHELRLSPVRKFVKSLIPSLGRIYYASAQSWLTSRNNLSVPFSWWFDASMGGGAWGAIGSHLIDQLRFFCGEIEDASVMLDAGVKERKDRDGVYRKVTADDISTAVVRFKEGFTGVITCIMVAPENKLDIEIVGEKGSIRIDIDGRVYQSIDNSPYKDVAVPMTERDIQLEQMYESSNMLKNKFSNAFIYAASDIVDAVSNGRNFIPGAATFEDGVEIQRILDKGWGHSFGYASG